MFKELFPRIRSFICARGQLYRMSSNRNLFYRRGSNDEEFSWNSGCGVRDAWLRKVWDFELCGFSEVKRLDDQVLELIVELLSTRVRFIFQGFAYSARALDYTITRVPRKSFADSRSAPSLLEKKLAPSQLCLWPSSAKAPATVNLPVPAKPSSTHV